MWENITAEFPDWRNFQDPDLLRKFREITVLGVAALSEEKLEEVVFHTSHFKQLIHI